MSKVSASLGLTLALNKDTQEYIKLWASIADIDTDLELEPQLELATQSLNEVIDTAEVLVNEKLQEMVNRDVLKLG